MQKKNVCRHGVVRSDDFEILKYRPPVRTMLLFVFSKQAKNFRFVSNITQSIAIINSNEKIVRATVERLFIDGMI